MKIFARNKSNLLKKPCRYFSKLLIKNAKITNSDRIYNGDILIDNGKISKIYKQDNKTFELNNNIEIIDANNNYVIPGGIDTHTHMQLPFMGTTAADDFNIGSKAALSGGTTSFIDFIIPNKNESLLKAYDRWRNWADPKVNCDYSLHCAITSWNEDIKKEMAEIVSQGISSFKVFLAYKGALMLNDGEFYKVLERCKELGALCLVHAENGDLLYEAQKKMVELGITGPEGHYLSRPESFEAEATHKAITIAEFINTPLYIVHVMSKDASFEVSRARAKGNILYGETLCAALGTDGKEMWNKNFDTAAGFVMSPPLNPDPTTKTHLMNLLQSNTLQVVGTDNCTFCKSQKRMGFNDFTKIPNGVNGIEDRLSIVWTKGVKEGLLSVQDFVRVTSTAAAQIFNMYPRKGIIEEGADADLVIWDGEKERVISKDTHHQAVDFNIFEGMKVKGEAVVTISAGKVKWKDGNFTNELIQGSGKFIERKAFGYPFERIKDLDNAKNPLNFKVDRSCKDSNNIDHGSSNLHETGIINKQQKYFDKKELINIDQVISHIENTDLANEINRIIYGSGFKEISVNKDAEMISKDNNFEIQAYKMDGLKEEIRKAKLVKIAAIQNSIVLPTNSNVNLQKQAIHEKLEKIITSAYKAGVNIIGLQELWNSPFFLCTREKYPWVEFAEKAEQGESINFLKSLAKKYNVVIISPILERDPKDDTLWNTSVVISNSGDILGKCRKNHIPRVGDFNESTYYMEGNTGNPVFETEFGRIGVNICYGRHHPLHWMALGLNGAEIVYNPSATVAGLSEHLWLVEARNAAIANSFFTVSINRVGSEKYPNKFTSGDGKPEHDEFGHFYGSSYITAPDGSRTKCLSRTNDGLLISEVDLNICRQVKDKWGFQMTARYPMYAELLQRYCNDKFEKQVIKDKFI
jgi:dihydropyrimidinase